MNFKYQGMREPAKVDEPSFGTGLLSASDLRFASRDHHTGKKHECHQNRSSNCTPVTRYEFRRPVAESVMACNHWQALKVATDISRKLFNRGVASLWFLA
jgi:hypothetical protein